MSKENQENVAIYGAGAAGIQLMEAMRKNPNYRVKLFIDDSPELIGKNLRRRSNFQFGSGQEKIKTTKYRNPTPCNPR